MSAKFKKAKQNLRAEEDPDPYRSQLWKETEWNGNHQAKDERGAYVSERSDKQRVPLEGSHPVKKNLFGQTWFYSEGVKDSFNKRLTFSWVAPAD